MIRDKVPDSIVLQKAAGPEPGTAELALCGSLSSLVPDKWFGEKSRFHNRTPSGTLQVEVITLDALIAEYGLPGFVKVDVEGYELGVLRGLSQPVNLLSFEYAPPFQRDAGRCLDYLADLGMTECNYRNGGGWDGFDYQWAHRYEILPKLPRQPDFGMLFARKPLVSRYALYA